MVWDDNGGVPGMLLYTQEKAMVQQGGAINGFYTYVWEKESVSMIYLISVGGRGPRPSWMRARHKYPSMEGNSFTDKRQLDTIRSAGSIMIRPVTDMPVATGINDILFKNRTILHFYPNRQEIFITIDNEELLLSGKVYVSFLDLRERKSLGSVNRYN